MESATEAMEQTKASRGLMISRKEWKEVGRDVVAAVTTEEEEANTSLIRDEEEDVLTARGELQRYSTPRSPTSSNHAAA